MVAAPGQTTVHHFGEAELKRRLVSLVVAYVYLIVVGSRLACTRRYSNSSSGMATNCCQSEECCFETPSVASLCGPLENVVLPPDRVLLPRPGD